MKIHTITVRITASLFFIILGITQAISVQTAADAGQACSINNDCNSGSCQASICIGKKIGQACSDDTQCTTGLCENSFCVCNDQAKPKSDHCENTLYGGYGGTASGWKCIDSDQDPDSSRGEWNFCKKADYQSTLPNNSTNDVRYPVESKAYMGEPCDKNISCRFRIFDGFDDECEETAIVSTQANDPWFDPTKPDKKLKVCECILNAFIQAPFCSAQYGPGTWNCVDGPGDLSTIKVCQNTDNSNWTPKDLAEMQKNVIKDENGSTVETTFLGFDISIDAPELVTPETKIGIPGVFFTNITKETHITTDGSGASWLNIPFLGEFISAIYKYSVGLISLIAVMVLIISGIQIITSAGNSEVISSAKHRIVSSVIAIVITAGSYTILYTVNPDLVNLKNLKILVVPGNNNYFSPSPEDENAEDDHGVTTNPTDKSVSFLPTDPIRVYDPKGAGTFGAQYLANCSAFANSNVSSQEGAKARVECRKACIAQLDEKAKSKKAINSSYSETYLGAMDCSAQGTRSLTSIKYIGIHEGGPGAIGTWWASNVRKQLPVGSHYFITPDGVIHQIADETFVMWHGVQNPTSIGIDLSVSGPNCAGGKPLPPEDVKNCTYTQAQYDSLNRLINEITARLSGRRPTLLGHCEYGASDHVDPRNFDWAKVQGETNEGHRKIRCAYVPGYPFGVRP
ncbi:MAG: N-acetylmuramoyl-L-alanine amidase [Candidatus Magasanikbacteria bacterium]|nr:N-acetylmuramoyl-L-alanine amidase [Candidatus Magasanikbacteria bacterium]